MPLHVRSRLLPAVALLAAVGCADDLPVTPSAGRAPFAPQPGRYLVGFDGPPAISPQVLAASGGRVVEEIPGFDVLVVDGVTNPAALRGAHPRYIEASFDVTLDPFVDETPLQAAAVPGAAAAPWHASNVQWDMAVMEADEGWAMTDGGLGINVCIVDTGVDDQHQELRGRVALRTNFVTTAGQNRADDPNGHGSHVAGSVAARGGVVSGVAPAATILSARVLAANGSGQVSWFVNGLRWCADNGAHVINVSLGLVVYRGQAAYIGLPITFADAIAYAAARGALVVAAAGNSNVRLPNPAQAFLPAQAPGALIVGATGPFTRSTAPVPPAWDPLDPEHVWQGPDTKAFYSNFGAAVHVFAPGGRGGVPLSSTFRFVNGIAQGGPHDQIWSVCSGQSARMGAVNAGGVPTGVAACTGTTDRYASFAGTSQATPHVSGLAALLYAELGGTRSPANRARVLQCIRGTTDDIGDPSVYGGGRVNVRKAIEAIRAGTC
jgi:subtilisin family serine protease